ncbi:MAG TPA: hypothetical protein ENI27_03675 [bacterium]|nr:hypothetical protein [bacterium]
MKWEIIVYNEIGEQTYRKVFSAPDYKAAIKKANEWYAKYEESDATADWFDLWDASPHKEEGEKDMSQALNQRFVRNWWIRGEG